MSESDTIPGTPTMGDKPKSDGRRRLMPLLAVLLAFALSFGIIRWHEMKNISPCVVNFTCNAELDRQRGDYRKTQYGFPVTYRATESFTRIPDDRRTYPTTVREFQPFNPFYAAMNVLFWGALLYYVGRLISGLRRKDKHTEADV